MKAATGLNVKRVVLGGLAAGLVLFVLTGVLNAALLKDEFQQWSQGMGSLIHPPAPGASMGLWTLMSFTYAFAGVWLYASILPRYGAGAKTALLAGACLWLVGKFATGLDLLALGIFPDHFVLVQGLGSLMVILCGTCVGAWVYKE